MIPKIIHYCWLSDDPIPEKLQSYIDNWKKVMPNYTVKKWDFSIFDKESSIWVSQAFDNKKYAFAADYIRLYAVYNEGGFYLDSDVEVLKSFDPFLHLKTVIGWEYNKIGLEIAAFGAEKNQKWLGDCLEYYRDKPFINADGTFNMKTLPLIIEETLKEKGYLLKDVHNVDEAISVNGTKEIPVFPTNYFSPKTFDGKINITNNTVSIHHFAASWTSPTHRILRKFILMIGGTRLKAFASFIYGYFNNRQK